MRLLSTLASLAMALVAAFLLLPVLALLTVANILAGLRRRVPVLDPELSQPVVPRASVVIPSWNGRELLEQCLPSLVAAVRAAGAGHEIIVVDNGSSDGSADWLRNTFPQVRVLRLEHNAGFGGGCNAGAAAARNDVLILLNNDMLVEPDFLGPLLAPFTNASVFAVTASIDLWQPGQRLEETGLTRGKVTWGQLWVTHEPVPAGARAARPVLYAGGGSTAYDRRKFLALGGFDPLFHPFYGEDTDLSYRAWKRGWQSLLQPASRVHHKHRGTIGAAFSAEYVQGVVRRNHLLFVWKNVGDPRLLWPGLVGLPLHWLVEGLAGRPAWRSLFAALRRLPAAVVRLWRDRPMEVASDSEVLLWSADPVAWLERFAPARPPRGGEPLHVLYLCPYFPYPPAHGGAVRMYNVVKRLAERHRVHVVSFIDREEEREGVAELARYCASVQAVLRRPRLSAHNPFGTRPLCLTEFESAQLRQVIANLLLEEPIDVMQVEYTQMAHYLYPSRHWATALTEHDLSFLSAWRLTRSDSGLLARARDFVAYLKMLRYELDICRRYDLVLAVTPREAEELRSYVPDVKVSGAAPTGVDAKFFAQPLPVEPERLPRSLLFVGYFLHRPNVDAILHFAEEVYPLIRAEEPEVQLTIVGKGAPAEVLALAELPGVQVAGYVEDIRACYRQHDVFIAPIRYGAGVRVKVVEAMAAGSAVVATSLGAEGIICEPGRDLLVADAPADFAAAVLGLLHDPERRRQLAASGQKVALERYDFDAIVRNLEVLYREALAGKRGVTSDSAPEVGPARRSRATKPRSSGDYAV